MAKKTHPVSTAPNQAEQQSSTLSYLFRERPETRRMSQEQISRDAMSGKPVCVSRSRDGTIGGMEQPQYQRSGSAYPVQPTENHVRISRHRMVERIATSFFRWSAAVACAALMHASTATSAPDNRTAAQTLAAVQVAQP
jgi:hypothetical protein